MDTHARAMAGDYVAAIDAMNRYLELAPDAPDARQAKDKIYEWEALQPASPQGTQGSGRGSVGPQGKGRIRR